MHVKFVEPVNDPVKAKNDPVNDPVNDSVKSKILQHLKQNPKANYRELAVKTGYSTSAVPLKLILNATNQECLASLEKKNYKNLMNFNHENNTLVFTPPL